MAQDPYKYFRLEARELLDHLGKAILALDKGAGADVVHQILRHAHTLKGAARVVRQREIADRAHAIEDALTPHREAAAIPPATVAKLLGFLDEIAGLVARLGDGAPASAPGSTPDDAPRSVRTELAEMDALLDGVMETHTRLGAIRGTARVIDDARQLADMLVDNLASPNPREVGGRSSPRTRAIAEQLRDLVRTSGRELGTAIEQLHRELVQVRDRAEQLRLVAAETLFISLDRTIRDAARALRKQVELESKGGDVRLDAHVLGAIHGALVQLARNAVAHGIESPQERIAAGKPPTGRVAIEVARRGRRVVFVCRDDGRGVDLDAVRGAAKRAGLALTESGMGAEAVLRLLLRGGLSTSSTITEVAGRGIGLDVVREVTERLGGSVVVRTAPSGTTFEIVVPASLASVEGLTIEMAGIRAIVPLDCVRRTARLAERDVSRTARAASIIHDGNMIPLVPLAEVLRASPSRDRGRTTRSTVIVEGSGGLAAVAAERLLGVSTVVVRPLPELAAADPIVAGAALDADGNPVLVLDPDGLVAEARRERSVDDGPEPVRHAVLVIDDSLTTRMLEQSILESAGFDVDTAISGEQGLEAARRKRYSLFLVDVEMPGIDGYTFIERIRADTTLRDTPAILVTSRSSAADRQRGDDVGAQGFIVKSEFDQGELVARIQRLVG